MKKIFIIVSSTILLANNLLAQNDADKKYRFGLKITPTPTWLRSDEAKLIEKASTKLGFGFGLQMEIKINSTASFLTGIGGDLLGGKQTYKNGQGYVLTKDYEYTDSKNTDFTTGVLSSGNKFYEIKSRTVKATYVTIPALLKLMTKDISGLKYYGIFGVNIAIQTKFKATDEISEVIYDASSSTTKYYANSGTTTITDMKPSGDLMPINMGLNVGIGAEYNLSGTTSLFFGIHYLRGFINQYQRNSQIMVDKMTENLNTGTKPANSKQSAFSDGIQLNIGILF